MGTDGKSFGEYLAYLREMKNVTLRELARQIGVSAPFLSDVEKGRSCPNISWSMSMLVLLYGQPGILKRVKRNGRNSSRI